MFSYNNNAITSTIIPLLQQTHLNNLGLYALLTGGSFVISILYKLHKGETISIVEQLTQGVITVSILLFCIFNLNEIINFSNLIADLFFPETTLKNFMPLLLKQASVSKDISVMNFNLTLILKYVSAFISGLYFFYFAIYRWVLLSFYYLILPFCVAISFLPTFGLSFVYKQLLSTFQISMWVVFHSILNLIYFSALQLQWLSELDLNQHYNLFFLVGLSIVYRAVILTIPSLSATIFGGGDHAPGAYAIAALQYLKPLGKHKK